MTESAVGGPKPDVYFENDNQQLPVKTQDNQN